MHHPFSTTPSSNLPQQLQYMFSIHVLTNDPQPQNLYIVSPSHHHPFLAHGQTILTLEFFCLNEIKKIGWIGLIYTQGRSRMSDTQEGRQGAGVWSSHIHEHPFTKFHPKPFKTF